MPIYVPPPGLKIRAKEGPIIPPEGIELNPHDPYYRRHILEGSLLAAPTPTPTPAPAKVKATKEAE